MNALEVKNISKSYGRFTLKCADFTVGEGRVAGLIGANGAGKTTIIKSILNIIPHDGDAEIFGISVKENEIAAKKLCGYAGGGFRFYGERRLKQIAYAVRGFYGDFGSDKFREYMDRFGLDENKRVKELSDGMKMKFSVALALSHGAKLLILDEPTSGLDPLSREEFCDTVSELVKHDAVSVLFSTHVTSDLSRIADDVIMLSGGEVLLCFL